MKPMQLIRLLKQILGKINSSENLGRMLIEQLKRSRDTEIDSPYQHQYHSTEPERRSNSSVTANFLTNLSV